MIYLQLLGGFIVLLAAAEIFVRGSVSLAKILRVPPLVIGMTVVAFGTSAPELMVSLEAAIGGVPGLAIGNVIGSNIANVLLILGASALVSPIMAPESAHRRDSVALFGGSAVFVLICLTGAVGFWSGAALIVLFAGFLVSTYRIESKDKKLAAGHIQEVQEIPPLKAPLWAVAAVTGAGLVGIIWGADLLIDASVAIARTHGISEDIIGLTLVAFGTSLPELAASVVAAFRGHSDIAVGNIVGSNLFNILGVAGLTAMVAPLPVSANMLTFDIWVMLGATALLLPILAGRWQFGTKSALCFLLAYGGYILINAHNAGLLGDSFGA
ncbi:MAG: calcium/sodium antiporter [Rhodospirillales bacterium]|nr:calcium/sodium antiporter [Rhodospirillales bacterium]